jgi:hypothetical protein
VKKTDLIPSLVYRTQEAVIAITKDLCIGTNLAIHDVLLTIMSGRLLETRGAIIPALSAMGLDKAACLRTRKAIQKGAWSIRQLLEKLFSWTKTHTSWQALTVAGYKINAIDTTCIYRPRLMTCKTKHYNSIAQKALPAINFAVLSAIGRIEKQKVSLPQLLIRGNDHALSEETLMQRLCEKSIAYLKEDDLVTADRKFPIMVMLESGINKVVVRRATNFTVRRVFNPKEPNQKTRGRPRKRGELIRPLERMHKGVIHRASTPDEISSWTDSQGRVLEARVWRGVVLTEQATWSAERKALNAAQAWRVVVVKHPDFVVPMVILLNLELSPVEAYTAMGGRWGVEQLPLVSKQLLGGHRMFVFETEMCFRLPELTFLAASVLMVVAAGCEQMPTGWWDLKAKPTAGRLRRVLSKVHDLRVLGVPVELCKKNSVTVHLPCGYHESIAKTREKRKSELEMSKKQSALRET